MKNVPSGSQAMPVGRPKCLSSLPATPATPRVIRSFFPSLLNLKTCCRMSSTTHTALSGSYGLILTACGPRQPSKSLSHWVHDAINLPLASTMTMQWRSSGFGPVAWLPREPHAPLKLLGSLSGSLISPRFAMKIRLGDSANIPPCDPWMYPCCAKGCGHLGTTSYGPVSSSPPFWELDESTPNPASFSICDWIGIGADSRLTAKTTASAISAMIGMRIRTSFDLHGE